jgi:drug/metabolite transporter (DMT)-like permease
VINALFYMPVWFLTLPSGLAQTETDVLLLQLVYQGLIPNLFGLIMIAHASRTIGAEVTSAWMAFVPAGATFLGVYILNETLPPSSWAALALLTLGLCLVSFAGKSFWHRKTGRHHPN